MSSTYKGGKIAYLFQNVYIDELGNIVNKYNHANQSLIRMKLVDVNSSTYIDFSEPNNKEDLKLNVVGYV